MTRQFFAFVNWFQNHFGEYVSEELLTKSTLVRVGFKRPPSKAVRLAVRDRQFWYVKVSVFLDITPKNRLSTKKFFSGLYLRLHSNLELQFQAHSLLLLFESEWINPRCKCATRDKISSKQSDVRKGGWYFYLKQECPCETLPVDICIRIRNIIPLLYIFCKKAYQSTFLLLTMWKRWQL